MLLVTEYVAFCLNHFGVSNRPFERRVKGGSFPGPCDVLGAPPQLKNTKNGVPGGFFLT